MVMVSLSKFNSHRLSELKTAVIRPDYLPEYINIALTCQWDITADTLKKRGGTVFKKKRGFELF